MQYLKILMESRPFLESVPDQSLIEDNYKGANHIQALRGNNYAFVYIPAGLKVKLVMGKIKGEKVKANWYDPRKGQTVYVGQFVNEGIVEFVPPTSGRNNDWVLILDDDDCIVGDSFNL